jgi:hypothetical protein
MKLTLSVLLLSAVSALAQITNLTFTWNPAPNAEVYRFWDGNRVALLGTTTNIFFTVTNWNTAVSRTVSVTASNEIGESVADVKTIKPATSTPAGLRTIPLSIVTPVPGVVELSQDLVGWSQRIRLSNGPSPSSVHLTWVQYPTEPVMFLRTKTVPLTTIPVP